MSLEACPGNAAFGGGKGASVRASRNADLPMGATHFWRERLGSKLRRPQPASCTSLAGNGTSSPQYSTISIFLLIKGAM